MTSESIGRIRALFEEELRNNLDLYHPIDIERVRTDDWQVRRFIVDQPDGIEWYAFKSLCEALQWKKAFGIHNRTDQYFPKEMWQLTGTQLCGQDKEGRLIQWEAIRKQRPFKEIHLLIRQFVAHCFERVDQLAGEQGYVFVDDASGAALNSVDIDLVKFKLEIAHYYPQGMKAIYIVNQPWVLNALIKIILNFSSAKLAKSVRCIKSSELLNIIDAKYIPETLQGNRYKDYYPSGLTPMEQKVTKLGMEEKYIAQFCKNYQLQNGN